MGRNPFMGGDVFQVPSPETPIVFAKVYLVNLQRYAVSLLCGSLDEGTSSQIVSELLFLADKHNKPPLLFINSPGGDFNAAMNIIDVMESLPHGVATFVSGEASSAALLVAMSGAKGHRWIAPTAQLMSHHYSIFGLEGSGKEIKAEKKRMDYIDQVMRDIYSRHTGLSQRAIRSMLQTESTWINPQEAVKKRMADHVGTEILREYLRTGIE